MAKATYSFIKERIKTIRALGYVRPKGFQFYFKEFVRHENGIDYRTRHNMSFVDIVYTPTDLFYSVIKREQTIAQARLSLYMLGGQDDGNN